MAISSRPRSRTQRRGRMSFQISGSTFLKSGFFLAGSSAVRRWARDPPLRSARIVVMEPGRISGNLGPCSPGRDEGTHAKNDEDQQDTGHGRFGLDRRRMGVLLSLYESNIVVNTLGCAQKTQQANGHGKMHVELALAGVLRHGKKAQNAQHDPYICRNQCGGCVAACGNKTKDAKEDQNDTKDDCSSRHIREWRPLWIQCICGRLHLLYKTRTEEWRLYLLCCRNNPQRVQNFPGSIFRRLT